MLEKQKAQRALLTEGPLLGKMLKFALPLMATGLLQTFYNAADMIVVGRFAPNGSFAMGAVGSCGSLINLIVNLFMGLSIGAGICVAQSIGAGKERAVRDIVHTSVMSGLICGIVVAVMGCVLADPLLRLMGTPDDILVEAVPYMQAYFVGVPALLVYNFLAAALRSSGDTKRPLIFLATAGIINVALNVVMVLVFGMGAVGVGIATTASQYASALMIIVYMSRYKGICHLELKAVRIHKNCLFAVIQNGLPAGVQSLVFSIANVLIQSTVNGYGPETVAGNSAAANIEAFIYIAMNSLFQTAVTFVAQNVGAGKVERVKRITLIALAIVIVTGAVLCCFCFVFNSELLSIYVDEEDKAVEARVIEAGIRRMSVVTVTYVLCGIMDVLCGVVRGMGKALAPTVISIFGTCLLRISWIYAVCPFAPGNILVLYMTFPITWAVTSIGHLCCALWAYRRVKRERDMAIA